MKLVKADRFIHPIRHEVGKSRIPMEMVLSLAWCTNELGMSRNITRISMFADLLCFLHVSNDHLSDKNQMKRIKFHEALLLVKVSGRGIYSVQMQVSYFTL